MLCQYYTAWFKYCAHKNPLSCWLMMVKKE